MQEANQKRVNRVYKSLHKPLTYLGIERSLFFIICVSAVGLFNIFNSILAGVAVFIGGTYSALGSRKKIRPSFRFSPRAKSSNCATTPPNRNFRMWRSADVPSG